MVPRGGAIQDEDVVTSIPRLVALLLACSLVGCAPSAAPPPRLVEPTVTTTTSANAAEPEVLVDAAPAARPRLSQTVTLGQGEVEAVTPSAPPTQAQSQSQSQSVIVNNTVVVPQYYGGYGGYGGYGYGGYGGIERGGRSSSRSGWGASGWEGAGRTAAPGRTPAVGGNWSPPPSYGPAQMK